MKNPKNLTSAAFLAILCSCLLLVLSGVAQVVREGRSNEYMPDTENLTYMGLVDWFKDTCQTFCTTNLPEQVKLMECNAFVNRLAGKWIFESTEVIRLNNGHLANAGFMNYETRPPDAQITYFQEFVETELNAPYLYTEAPCKLCEEDPQLPMKDMTNANETTTLMLERLEDAGVEVLDLHQRLHAAGLNHYDSFFRTDHHWTVPTGLWAARTMAEELNARFALDLHTDVLAEENFGERVWEKVFVGSWGRKVTAVFAPPEDFALPVPIEPVHVRLTRNGNVYEGGFDTLYDEDKIVPDNFYTGNSYGSLLYGDCGYIKVENLDYSDGPVIVLLRESFAGAVGPYLALTAGELHLVDARYYTGSIKELLAELQPDVVVSLLNVQCYANVYFDMVT